MTIYWYLHISLSSLSKVENKPVNLIELVLNKAVRLEMRISDHNVDSSLSIGTFARRRRRGRDKETTRKRPIKRHLQVHYTRRQEPSGLAR